MTRDERHERATWDYRCNKGHPFAAPEAEHGGPWSTLVCPVTGCGATATLLDCGCGHVDDPTYNGRWCGYCNPEFGGDSGAAA